MKLLVRVIEAKGLLAMGPNGYTDPYVKLKLGKQKFRSTVVKKCSNPIWCEEFTLKVDDLKEDLIVSVLDEEKYFNHEYLGQIKIPVIRVYEAKDQSLGTAWYTLYPKDKKAKSKDCGQILLTICFSQNSVVDLTPVRDPGTKMRKCSTSIPRSSSLPCHLKFPSPSRSEEALSSKEENYPSTLAGLIANMFNKNMESPTEASDPSVEQEGVDPVYLDPKVDEQPTSVDFEEMMKTMEMREPGGEVPDCLSGGVVLDQLYAVTTKELNATIFSPNSSFWKSSAEAARSTDLQVGAWKFENSISSFKRVVSYTKAPTKIVKSLKAMEDHTYLKADGKNFVVLATVHTPDAPYGKTFKVEVQYCLTPGPEQPSGEPCSRIVVSWRMNFIHSTMMKCVIENGAKQGIKDNFEQFERILSQVVKPFNHKDHGSEKDKLLASLRVEHQSDWKLAVQYLTNVTVIFTTFLGLYVIVHFWMARPSTTHGLEFISLDLPDSICELLVSGVLVLTGKHALDSIARFMHARVQKGSDHGIKARGDGWLLTVALIEGMNLKVSDSSGLTDTYVVFTCNGKKRTSSTKFQRSDPLWNEIFEFDAMDGPPSMFDVEVFGFDGPFAEAKSLGRTEINFLKYNISHLSDIWIPLNRDVDQGCQPKLHLRIFMNNSKGNDAVKEYVSKIEKEIGKKIKLRSAQTHSAFQKLFGLPPEEFLINDFVCSLKRKTPHQGRLFLSSRVVAFHSDLFGNKIKFFFLWEDVEDIHGIPSRLGTSAVVTMILKPGKGSDAQHGARTQDEDGRLKFHFQSFVSSNLALRTIMALWRSRTINPKQKEQIAEEESTIDDKSQALDQDPPLPENLQCAVEEPDAKSHPSADEETDSSTIQNEENTSFQEVGLADMFIVYSSILSLPMSFFMELFSGTEIEKWVMEKAGCLDYFHTPWESEKPDVYQRQVQYRFDKLASNQKGKARSTQQKSPMGKSSWIITEVIFPEGDSFTIHLKYLVESLLAKSVGCSIQVYLGISWPKYNSNRQKKKVSKAVISNLQTRFKVISSTMEKEYISAASGGAKSA